MAFSAAELERHGSDLRESLARYDRGRATERTIIATALEEGSDPTVALRMVGQLLDLRDGNGPVDPEDLRRRALRALQPDYGW